MGGTEPLANSWHRNSSLSNQRTQHYCYRQRRLWEQYTFDGITATALHQHYALATKVRSHLHGYRPSVSVCRTHHHSAPCRLYI